jgi:hypothetical protein
MITNVFIWFLSQENIGLHTNIMILHRLVPKILSKLELTAAILELCKLGLLPLLLRILRVCCYGCISEDNSAGIDYVAISGGSYHRLPGLIYEQIVIIMLRFVRMTGKQFTVNLQTSSSWFARLSTWMLFLCIQSYQTYRTTFYNSPCQVLSKMGVWLPG